MKKLAAHVRSLIRTHKLKVRWLSPEDSVHDSGIFEKCILLKHIKSPGAYAVAMHEIGHILSKSMHQPTLFKEALAWQWAKANALHWSAPMQRALVVGLRSHVQLALADYEQALPRQIKLPPEGHIFWALAKDLPETKALLRLSRAVWLAKHLPVVPWGDVLAHPQRPRCSNCQFWNPAVAYAAEPRLIKEKREWGFCLHEATPLGVEMTPGGALCGTSWLAKH